MIGRAPEAILAILLTLALPISCGVAAGGGGGASGAGAAGGAAAAGTGAAAGGSAAGGHGGVGSSSGFGGVTVGVGTGAAAGASGNSAPSAIPSSGPLNGVAPVTNGTVIGNIDAANRFGIILGPGSTGFAPSLAPSLPIVAPLVPAPDATAKGGAPAHGAPSAMLGNGALIGIVPTIGGVTSGGFRAGNTAVANPLSITPVARGPNAGSVDPSLNLGNGALSGVAPAPGGVADSNTGMGNPFGITPIARSANGGGIAPGANFAIGNSGAASPPPTGQAPPAAPAAVQGISAQDQNISKTGLAVPAEDGVSTKIVPARPCRAAARETDGTTSCVGIPERRAR